MSIALHMNTTDRHQHLLASSGHCQGSECTIAIMIGSMWHDGQPRSTSAWSRETSLQRNVDSMMSSLAARASSNPGDEKTPAAVSPVKATSGVTTGYVTSCK